MSKVSLTGNASGTGTLTVAAPNTNSDYTLTLPTETGTVATQAYAAAKETVARITGATASYTVVPADQGKNVLASPNAGATLTINLLDVDAVYTGAVFCFTNSGPTAPSGNVKLVLDSGDTFMGSSGEIYLAGDETLVMWPDSSGSHNWFGVSSKPTGERQHYYSTFTSMGSTTSTSQVSTGFSGVLPEKLQTLISREYVEFRGTIGADITNRVVTMGIYDGTSIVAEKAYSPSDGNGLMEFCIGYRNSGLRSTNTPTTYSLYWKVNAGTGWINRQASAATGGRCEVIIRELPIC